MTVITTVVFLEQVHNVAVRYSLFSQEQLNDLIRYLALSKEASEVLASCLSEHGILDFKTQSMFYRHKDEVLNNYFAKECNSVFCKNIKDRARMGVPNINWMNCLFYR